METYPSQKFTSPIVSFEYPKFIVPDTKFDDFGRYEARGTCDPMLAADLADQLDQVWNKHKTTVLDQVRSNYRTHDLPWGFKDVDGVSRFFLKTKTKASGIDKTGKAWSRQVTIFDAQGNVVTDRESLNGMWSGTTGRISFSATPFFGAGIGAGVSLRLNAVQIINLQTKEGNTADHGFKPEEGWASTAKAPAKASNETVPFDATASIGDDPFDF